MRYTGPKRRLSRREGVALFAKDTAILERKGATLPGMRGTKVRPRTSEYGTQLREKQKAKRLFGMSEKQFRNTFKDAAKSKTATGLTLLELLERRLDNIVYRLGFSPSRMGARQLVSHGKVTVDGINVNIPSFRVDINSVVAIEPKFVDNVQVKKSLENSSDLVGWLERKGAAGQVLRKPNRDEMESIVTEQLIVEYYSR